MENNNETKCVIKFVKVVCTAKLPSCAHEGDVGFDLATIHNITLQPHTTKAIDTGLKLAHCNEKILMKIEGRSGLALKGIFPVGGIIDTATYRGNIKVILHNSTDEAFSLFDGDKIAQAVFYPVLVSPDVVIKETDKVEDVTTRGEGGFGSTGA